MAYTTIDCSVADGTATVRFNRPKKLNAMNPAMVRELDHCFAECEHREDVRSMILTGSEKAFIAGADIEAMAEGDVNLGHEVAVSTFKMQERLAELDMPTIAAISGYALGGGLELALCCDFRIASETAVFGLPEITLGIIPGGGGTQRLPRLIGLSRATELLFLGTTIDARKALVMGLVNQVCAPSDLSAEAGKLAGRLNQLPAVALRACKRSMRLGYNAGLKEGLLFEQTAFSMLFGTKDQKEGMAAFMEKRKPKYCGQ